MAILSRGQSPASRTAPPPRATPQARAPITLPPDRDDEGGRPAAPPVRRVAREPLPEPQRQTSMSPEPGKWRGSDPQRALLDLINKARARNFDTSEYESALYAPDDWTSTAAVQRLNAALTAAERQDRAGQSAWLREKYPDAYAAYIKADAAGRGGQPHPGADEVFAQVLANPESGYDKQLAQYRERIEKDYPGFSEWAMNAPREPRAELTKLPSVSISYDTAGQFDRATKQIIGASSAGEILVRDTDTGEQEWIKGTPEQVRAGVGYARATDEAELVRANAASVSERRQRQQQADNEMQAIAWAGAESAKDTTRARSERERTERAQFERAHVKLPGDEYVPVADWSRLPAKYQAIGLRQGFDAMMATLRADEAQVARDRQAAEQVLADKGYRSGDRYNLPGVMVSEDPDAIAAARTLFADEQIKAAETWAERNWGVGERSGGEPAKQLVRWYRAVTPWEEGKGQTALAWLKDVPRSVAAGMPATVAALRDYFPPLDTPPVRIIPGGLADRGISAVRAVAGEIASNAVDAARALPDVLRKTPPVRIGRDSPITKGVGAANSLAQQIPGVLSDLSQDIAQAITETREANAALRVGYLSPVRVLPGSPLEKAVQDIRAAVAEINEASAQVKAEAEAKGELRTTPDLVIAEKRLEDMVGALLVKVEAAKRLGEAEAVARGVAQDVKRKATAAGLEVIKADWSQLGTTTLQSLIDTPPIDVIPDSPLDKAIKGAQSYLQMVRAENTPEAIERQRRQWIAAGGRKTGAGAAGVATLPGAVSPVALGIMVIATAATVAEQAGLFRRVSEMARDFQASRGRPMTDDDLVLVSPAGVVAPVSAIALDDRLRAEFVGVGADVPQRQTELTVGDVPQRQPETSAPDFPLRQALPFAPDIPQRPSEVQQTGFPLREPRWRDYIMSSVGVVSPSKTGGDPAADLFGAASGVARDPSWQTLERLRNRRLTPPDRWRLYQREYGKTTDSTPAVATVGRARPAAESEAYARWKEAMRAIPTYQSQSGGIALDESENEVSLELRRKAALAAYRAAWQSYVASNPDISPELPTPAIAQQMALAQLAATRAYDFALSQGATSAAAQVAAQTAAQQAVSVLTNQDTALQQATQAQAQAQTLTQQATNTAVRQAVQQATQTLTQSQLRTLTRAAVRSAAATRMATVAVPSVATATATATEVARVRVRRIPLPLPPVTGGIGATSGKSIPPGSIAWRQGVVWKYIPPPWDQPKPLTVRGAPVGARTGGRTPSETIQMIGEPGANVPVSASIDLGVADIFVDDFGRSIAYTGRGLETDVGAGVPGTTTGMSIPAVGAVASISRRRAKKMVYPIEGNQGVSRLTTQPEDDIIEEVIEEAAPEPEPRPAERRADDMSDLFRVTKADISGDREDDNNNDLFAVDTDRDVLDLDKDGTFDSLFRVTSEDIMGSPPQHRRGKPRRVVRRIIRRAAPGPQMGRIGGY